MTGAPLLRTPLYSEQAKLGGKFVPFAGYEMPVQFSGLTEEHNRVRTAVGIFDVSHMGEIRVSGPGALEYLQRVTTNDVSKLTPGRAQYSLLLYESGGVVDDIIIYMMSAADYFICVNASNRFKDYDWLKSLADDSVQINDLSDAYAQIAVQGPRAPELVERVLGLVPGQVAIAAFPPFTFQVSRMPGAEQPMITARTGYTGEDGFELFIPKAHCISFWQSLLDSGKDLGVLPCGLGARDTLRLEASYPLYGHELLPDVPALSSGVGWVVKFDKGEFVGRQALASLKATGLPYKLSGIVLTEPGIAREGTKLFSLDGSECGWVTSGTRPPTLQQAVGIALIKPNLSAPGTELAAEVRGKQIKCKTVKLPFYKRGQPNSV